MMHRMASSRRIKSGRTYTAPELAVALGVATGTVRRWVRDGLPLIDSERPKLIHGGEFLTWHKAKQKARKIKCGPFQMYCCKCRAPRQLMLGSAVVIHRNEKSATVKALCAECGTAMNRHSSKENATEWVDAARPAKGQKLSLVASPKPLVIVASGTPTAKKAG
jgi:hypothetical protein